MARQTIKKIIRLVGIIAGTVVLLPFLSLSPVLAESLVSSPAITQLEMLPGTTARIVLSIENRADTSNTFHFTLDQITDLREGYTKIPDLSWLNINTEDIELASGEQYWVLVFLSVPDDESLKGQKWQANINITCREQPILSSNCILMISVGEAAPPGINWGMIVIIAVSSAIAVIMWNRWKEKQRAKWSTGLKTKHWVA